MIIDTDKGVMWVKTHLKISIPIGIGILSVYTAHCWQNALHENETALSIFYFFVTACTGLTSAALTICHFIRLGLF